MLILSKSCILLIMSFGSSPTIDDSFDGLSYILSLANNANVDDGIEFPFDTDIESYL